MDFALQVCWYLVWLPLQVLTISAILRSGVRRYPLIFIYLVASFLTAVMEIPASLAYFRSDRTHFHEYEFRYWVDEGIRVTLVFAVVIGLIYRASANLRSRRIVRLVLVFSSLLFVGISFLLHYDSRLVIGTWMTLWTRDMKFCATILDFALWAMILASKGRDYKMLQLSGALGIMFAGEAIGESIRTLAMRNQSHLIAMGANVWMFIADVTFLYIWWQAFRKESEMKRAAVR